MAIDPGAQALYDIDPSAMEFGIELVEASDQIAVVRMTVTREMCNGFEIAHGGMTFLLADSAMAFASNSGLQPGQVALASSATVDWTAPVPLGTTLTATCRHSDGAGRSRIWDIEVTDASGTTVAKVRGRTRIVAR